MGMIKDRAEEETDLTARRGTDENPGESCPEESVTEELSPSRALFEPGICTIQGDRSSQQDALLTICREGIVLAAVCDGMGGMNGGERAAQCAREVIGRRFEEMLPDPDMPGIEDWFRETFSQADREIASLTGLDGSPLGGGSTAVAAVLKDGRYAFGSVGDSRIYAVRSGAISVLTKDHNYYLRLNDLLLRGEITKSEYRKESVRGEALISFLGMDGLSLIDTGISREKLKAGDCLLLCSDGIYKSLSPEQILAILEESGCNAALSARRLCSHAYRFSRLLGVSQDNATAIVLGQVPLPDLSDEAPVRD